MLHHLAFVVHVGCKVLNSCKDRGASTIQWTEFLLSSVKRRVMFFQRIECKGGLFTRRLLTLDHKLSDSSGHLPVHLFLLRVSFFSGTFRDMIIEVNCADSLLTPSTFRRVGGVNNIGAYEALS